MANPQNPSVVNFTSLRWSIAALLLASVIAAAAVLTTLRIHQNLVQTRNQVMAEQSQTRARLARASDDEREIRNKIDRYQEILARGRTQPERRLEWVETLKHIKQNRRLIDLVYEIGPQRPLDDKNRISGGFAFLASPMQLEMSLLHEGDLLGLLADLSASQPALTSVRHCRIERGDHAGGERGNLKAQCEIDWITLQEKL